MKKLLLICMFLILSTSAYADLDISDQCKGKEVSCVTSSIGFCTLLHCVPVDKYDKDGKYIGTSECPNQCHYTKTRKCWCDSYEWEVIVGEP